MGMTVSRLQAGFQGLGEGGAFSPESLRDYGKVEGRRTAAAAGGGILRLSLGLLARPVSSHIDADLGFLPGVCEPSESRVHLYLALPAALLIVLMIVRNDLQKEK